ncbi:hypothetical protein HMPREF3218_0201242 [Prevotella bivia]|nr:hypothetical protein HMPREF3218_0201242 [Prevotella bivia]
MRIIEVRIRIRIGVSPYTIITVFPFKENFYNHRKPCLTKAPCTRVLAKEYG